MKTDSTLIPKKIIITAKAIEAKDNTLFLSIIYLPVGFGLLILFFLKIRKRKKSK